MDDLNLEVELSRLFKEQQFERIIALTDHPKVASTYGAVVWRARAYSKLGKYDLAMQDLNWLLDNDPEQYAIMGEKATLLFKMGHGREAVQLYSELIQKEPENDFWYACRAYVLDKQGMVIEAVRDYEKASALDPENAITLNNLALVQMKLGYTNKAKFHAEKADLLGVDNATAPNHENFLQVTEEDDPPEMKGYWDVFRSVLFTRKGFAEFMAFIKNSFKTGG